MNNDAATFFGTLGAGFLGGLLIGLVIGANLGVSAGHNEACASVKAEWRDGKCVRVIVEDVK